MAEFAPRGQMHQPAWSRQLMAAYWVATSSRQGSYSPECPVPAQLGDAEALLALREAASAWLAGRGIRQWKPGEVTLQQVRDQIAVGDWQWSVSGRRCAPRGLPCGGAQPATDRADFGPG